MHLKFCLLARNLLITGAVIGFALAPTQSKAQGDPPPGSARVANINGNLSIQPNGVDGWGQAYRNQPAGPGDRFFTDQDGQSEIQVADTRAYIGPNTDFTIVNFGYQGIELGIAQGSTSLFSDGLQPNASITVQTPNGAVTLTGRGGFRIDVYPDQQSTIVTNYQNWGPI
jgi:hypothetical protein